MKAQPLPIRANLTEAERDRLAHFLEQVGFKPHPDQLDFITNRARYKILLCGRRWGKSYTLAIEIFLHVMEIIALGWNYGRVRLCAMNYNQINEPFAYLRKLMENVGIPLERRSTREENYYQAGPVMIEKRPITNRKALRGAGLTMLVVDEASLVPADVFWYELLPSVADYQGRILIAGTPKGINWPVEFAESKGIRVPYEELNRSYMLVSDDGECCLMRSPSWRNPYIDREFIESQRSIMDELAFRQEYGAEIIVEYQKPFPTMPALLSEPLPDSRLIGARWAVGLDYGYMDPAARVTVAKLVSDHYYVRDVGYETGLNAYELPQWCRKGQYHPNTVFVADPSFFNEDGRVPIVRYLLANGIHPIKASWNRTARWNLLRDLFAQGKVLLYAPACAALIQELTNAQPRASNPDDIEKPDHAISALSYALEYLYPLPIDVPMNVPWLGPFDNPPRKFPIKRSAKHW